MKHFLVIGTLALSVLLVGSCEKTNNVAPEETLTFAKPSHFPEPAYNMSQNPVTKAGFELGKKLFYDGKLSRDGSISCGSCHISFNAFTHHGHDVSHGIDDRRGTRNAPAVVNMAWYNNFFWDGGVTHLDNFPLAPIENPVEMDENIANVLDKLRRDPAYPPMFERAFGSRDINTATFLKALSQFMNMIVSADSPFDEYLKGNANAVSQDVLNGYAVFQQHCERCHSGVLTANNSFANNGIATTNDLGRELITGMPNDRYVFKVPSLRNLGYTAPYMHDGRFGTLDDVLDHYTNYVRTTASANTDNILRNGISLIATERTNLKLFLNSLNDEKLIRNRLFAE